MDRARVQARQRFCFSVLSFALNIYRLFFKRTMRTIDEERWKIDLRLEEFSRKYATVCVSRHEANT